jgi:hypothetical protein
VLAARAGLKEEMNFRSVKHQMVSPCVATPHPGYLILQLGGWGIWNRAGWKGVSGHRMGRALERGSRMTCVEDGALSVTSVGV